MPSRAKAPVDRFLATHDAAAYLGLSPRTLEKLRIRGGGPVFRKLRSRVLYALSDLDHWADQARRTSTADPGPAAPAPERKRR